MNSFHLFPPEKGRPPLEIAQDELEKSDIVLNTYDDDDDNEDEENSSTDFRNRFSEATEEEEIPLQEISASDEQDEEQELPLIDLELEPDDDAATYFNDEATFDHGDSTPVIKAEEAQDIL